MVMLSFEDKSKTKLWLRLIKESGKVCAYGTKKCFYVECLPFFKKENSIRMRNMTGWKEKSDIICRKYNYTPRNLRK